MGGVVLSLLFEALEVISSHGVSILIAYGLWCPSYTYCDDVIIVPNVTVADPRVALLYG